VSGCVTVPAAPGADMDLHRGMDGVG